MSDGQLICGGDVLPTVTLKLQVLLSPDSPSARQVTCEGPGGKVAPLGGVQVRLGIAQVSEALAM
jgi:hypothetical protein